MTQAARIQLVVALMLILAAMIAAFGPDPILDPFADATGAGRRTSPTAPPALAFLRAL